jgi:hypothetical protein
MRVPPEDSFKSNCFIGMPALPEFQLGRILEEFAYHKKNFCRCGKHARKRCQPLPRCTIGAHKRRHVAASCRILVKQPAMFPELFISGVFERNTA